MRISVPPRRLTRLFAGVCAPELCVGMSSISSSSYSLPSASWLSQSSSSSSGMLLCADGRVLGSVGRLLGPETGPE